MLDDQPPALRWLLPRLSVPRELHPDLGNRLAGPNGQRPLAVLTRGNSVVERALGARRRAHAPPHPRPAVRRAALPAPATAHLPGAPPRDRVAAPNLSPREREVLHQLAGRHSTTQMAATLALSTNTLRATSGRCSASSPPDRHGIVEWRPRVGLL